MSFNVLTFLNKTTHINDRFCIFPDNTTYQQVLEWCIENDISGFSRDSDGIFTARSPDIHPSIFFQSLTSSIPLNNDHHFYIIIQNNNINGMNSIDSIVF